MHFRRLLVFGFYLLVLSLNAQNQWFLVMREGNYPQSYQFTEEFPAEYIRTEWRKGNRVTNMSYGDGKWMVVMSGNSDYTTQSYKLSEAYPGEWISQKWDEGYAITHLGFGDNQWAIVMSKGSNLYGNAWATRSYFPENYISTKWDEGRDIVHLAYGSGEWAVVLSKGVGFLNQKYIQSENYPNDWIKNQYNQDYNITAVGHGETDWVVIMSQLAEGQLAETCGTRDEFPSQFIKDEWDNGKRIVVLQSDYHFDNSSQYKDWYEKGNQAYQKGDYEEAIQYYTQAIDLQPNNSEAYNARGWSKYLLKQYQGAILDATKSLQINPKHYTYHTRGAAYIEMQHYNKAIQDLTKAIQLYPEDHLYFSDRAKAYAQNGLYQKAISDYQEAKQLNPKESHIYENKISNLRHKTIENQAPEITWDFPTRRLTISKSPTVGIKACISSIAPIRDYQVLVNGQSYTTRGFEIVGVCDKNIDQKIKLKSGKNYIKIIVKTATKTTTSEERVIQYTGQTGGNYHALLIAAEDYQDDNIKDLDNPIQDAENLKRILQSNYTFSPHNITLLKNPKKDDILNTLMNLQDNLKQKDHLLIFYAGHGTLKNNVGYWLPTDAHKTNRLKWFSNSELTDYVKGIKAGHTLVITDACFSGSIVTGLSRDLNQVVCEAMEKLPSRRAMSSGALSTVPDNSVFMKYLLKKLRDNFDSCLSAEDLYAQLKKAVIYNSPNQQVPQFGVLPMTGDEGGNFIFKRR